MSMTHVTLSGTDGDPSSAAGLPVRIGLWTTQVLLAVVFGSSGFMKLTMPVSDLAAMMPWTGQVATGFLRFVGAVDLAGGLGILLPSLTRIQPRLTVLAALGIVALQLLAAGFHVTRGETFVLPLNAVLLALSAFVAWGRSKAAPVTPRT